MSDTLKSAGADCPKCEEPFCAEYAMLGAAPKWSCGACGAGGPLSGVFTARKPPAPSVNTPQRHKHWSDAT